MPEPMHDQFLHVGCALSWGRAEQPRLRGSRVLIDPMHYGIAGSEYTLCTENVFTCMGVVLHNQQLRVGVLAHVMRDEYAGLCNDVVDELHAMLRRPRHGFSALVLGVSCFLGYAGEVSENLRYARRMQQLLENRGYCVAPTDRFIASQGLARNLQLNVRDGSLRVQGYLCQRLTEDILIDVATGNVAGECHQNRH